MKDKYFKNLKKKNKIALVKLINNYPKIKNSSLFLPNFKEIFENDYRNLQKKKKNATEFK